MVGQLSWGRKFGESRIRLTYDRLLHLLQLCSNTCILTSYGAQAPCWSPDGGQIVYELWTSVKEKGSILPGTSYVNLYIVNADGTGYRPLVEPQYDGWQVDPCWR